MDWLDLLAVQRTLKSLLQHHSSKASILRCLAFFIVHVWAHPYMTTGKTTALTRRTFVGKVISLLFNMLSRLVIIFLPRSKLLLISWLQSPSAMILEPQKIKSDTVSTVSPSICHEVMGPDAMTLVFWMLSFQPTFSLSSFTFIKRLFSSSSLSAIRVVSSAYLRLLMFLLAILIPVDIFLEFPAFSESSLNIWKFLVHVLLKPSLESFERYFAGMWKEYNCAVVWKFFGIDFLWDWNENWPFPVLWPLLSFPNLLACWVQHFHSIIFQDLE